MFRVARQALEQAQLNAFDTGTWPYLGALGLPVCHLLAYVCPILGPGNK